MHIMDDLALSKATVPIGIATSVDNVSSRTGLGKVDIQHPSFLDLTIEAEVIAGGTVGSGATLTIEWAESGASIGLSTAMIEIQSYDSMEIVIPSAVADGSIVRDLSINFNPGGRYLYVGYQCADITNALATLTAWINKL